MISEEEIRFYKSIIHELDIVFDVGCRDDNVFDELKPGIEAHLFDPVMSKTLMDSIAGKPNIWFNNLALGSEKGTTLFHPAYGSILERRDEPKCTDHHTIEVMVSTVYDYCRANDIDHIDLLKIDAEGYDFEVIKGCGSFINRIKYLQFEHWTDEMVKQIIDYLPPHKLITLNSKPKNHVAVL